MLLSGVRSSCDMFARNSDLYFEVRASCSAFSWMRRPARSTSRFLRLDLRLLLGEKLGALGELLVGLLQLALLLLQELLGFLQRLGLRFQPLVGFGELLLLALQLLGQRLRLLEQLLGAHAGNDRVEHDADRFAELIEEGELDVGEAVEGRELDDRLHLALEDDRLHDDVLGRRLAEAGGDLDVVLGTYR